MKNKCTFTPNFLVAFSSVFTTNTVMKPKAARGLKIKLGQFKALIILIIINKEDGLQLNLILKCNRRLNNSSQFREGMIQSV